MAENQQMAQDWAAIRQAKGITLEQISQSTKIRVAALRAIEEGRFQDLPGGIYTASYVKQYAAAIGLDDALVFSALLTQLGRSLEIQNQDLLRELIETRLKARKNRTHS
jgi:cytoskeletal protein RodZ